MTSLIERLFFDEAFLRPFFFLFLDLEAFYDEARGE